MKLIPTALEGAFYIDVEAHPDPRGSFATLYTPGGFASLGLNTEIRQLSVSYNRERGTLRGLHYQPVPYAEVRVVSCVGGAIFDVMVDLRPASPTFLKWVGTEIHSDSFRMVYVPEGFAHGFETLEPATVVHYQISVDYRADQSRGIRWDDPEIGVQWPIDPPAVISPRDAGLPLLQR